MWHALCRFKALKDNNCLHICVYSGGEMHFLNLMKFQHKIYFLLDILEKKGKAKAASRHLSKAKYFIITKDERQKNK